jgi:ATP-dependent protease ClpP protease subunit
MYTALKSYVGNSVGRIVGVAASAAGVASMGVKKLIISPTAQFMLHNAAGETRGDYRAHEHSADMLKGWNKSIANAYILKTGMPQNELLGMMNKETWLNAQDALKNKFVDEIMFDDELKLSASLRTSGLLPREVINKVRNELTKQEGIKARAEPDNPDTETLKAKLALELEL